MRIKKITLTEEQLNKIRNRWADGFLSKANSFALSALGLLILGLALIGAGVILLFIQEAVRRL